MGLKRKFESPGVVIESWVNDVGVHDYGLTRRTWVRACRFIDHFGFEHALQVIDQRAERAADRGDYETAKRWRTVITAIHAIQEDERLLGEKSH